MKHTATHTLTALLIATSTFLGGCQTAGMQSVESIDLLSQLKYPEDADVADVDIIVVRKGSQIELTNRTARSYENMQLWLNQTHVNVVEAIAIGPGNRYVLPHFIDRHGHSFPVALFLKPDAASPVVLAELYDPAANRRYRLTTRMDNQDDMMRRAH